jgi:hypothetical protein
LNKNNNKKWRKTIGTRAGPPPSEAEMGVGVGDARRRGEGGSVFVFGRAVLGGGGGWVVGGGGGWVVGGGVVGGGVVGGGVVGGGVVGGVGGGVANGGVVGGGVYGKSGEGVEDHRVLTVKERGSTIGDDDVWKSGEVSGGGGEGRIVGGEVVAGGGSGSAGKIFGEGSVEGVVGGSVDDVVGGSVEDVGIENGGLNTPVSRDVDEGFKMSRRLATGIPLMASANWLGNVVEFAGHLGSILIRVCKTAFKRWNLERTSSPVGKETLTFLVLLTV